MSKEDKNKRADSSEQKENVAEQPSKAPAPAPAAEEKKELAEKVSELSPTKKNAEKKKPKQRAVDARKTDEPEQPAAKVEIAPVGDATGHALGASPEELVYDDEARKDVITSVQKILKPKGNYLTRAEMIEASRQLKRVMPYNYEAWRLHADVLLDALKQLETRQIQPDENFKILAIPLREADIRDAAESALRQCAHYAVDERRRIALIDEANSVRRLTWF